MNILVTGADGFIGKNLCLQLSEYADITVVPFTRQHSAADLPVLLASIDAVVHLAGVNRPHDPAEFQHGNADLTRSLCQALTEQQRSVPVLYSSSIQATLDNPYGESKLAAEQALLDYAAATEAQVFIYRLPNVFGKWAKPNYNSAVATFCHNIAHGLPIQINDPAAVIQLVYVDDVIASFKQALGVDDTANNIIVDTTTRLTKVEPCYHITVGDLAQQIQLFKASRESLVTENVGVGLTRALYATYVSYLTPEQFSYKLPKYGDDRGVFVEMLKTKESGQFSFFTAHPSITRGGHYHHSKTEKFLVIKGNACFRFRHMITGEFYELFTSGGQPEIVETVTGWTHDITNVGDEEMIVMLWANEIFDREKPDTYACPVGTQP